MQAQAYVAQPMAAPASPFAAINTLGVLKSEHRVRGTARWVGVVLGGLSLCVSGFLVLLALYTAFTTYGTRRDPIEEMLPSLIGGIVFVPIAGLFFFLAWRNWPLAAALFEHGFAHIDRKGQKPVRWDEIDSVWQSIVRRYVNGVYAGTHYRYTVLTRARQTIVMDDRLTNVEQLGSAIVKTATTTLLPGYARALESGQRVTFGPIAIDRAGIYSGNKSASWTEVRAVKVQRGVLSVQKDGKWLNWTSAMVANVPNFHLLMILLSKLTKVE